mgnify:FL=1
MWHLEFLSSVQEREYIAMFWERMKINRDNIPIKSVKKYLTDDLLREILISRPQELYGMCEDLKSHLFPRGQYGPVIDAYRKKKRSRIEKDRIKRFKQVLDVFDYEYYINKSNGYKLARLIGQNSCVYCNRQYTLTVDNPKNIVRPEFDHYLPKSKYPFFAMSLYNLIPSCHICNSSCKGTKEFCLTMNPYLTDGNKEYFTFSYEGSDAASLKVTLKDIDPSAKELCESFHLKEIYNAHSQLELKDLYTFAQKYSSTYLKDILPQTVRGFTPSQEEAFNCIFGTEIDRSKDNNRPLSKFKRDILTELKVRKLDE